MSAAPNVIAGSQARQWWRERSEKQRKVKARENVEYAARKRNQEEFQKRIQRARAQERLEHPGRAVGKPHGTWITDIAEMQQGIVLCGSCQRKFNPLAYHYYRTKEFNILGRCDACKEHNMQGNTFFIHEKLLGQRSGECWKPR